MTTKNRLAFHLLLISVALLFSLHGQAQSPAWQWAKNYGIIVTSVDNKGAIATDAAGNIFVAGSFRYNSIVFGSFTLTNNSASSLDSDGYLLKCDASGNVLWATSFGGSSNEIINSLCVDAKGNCIVTGFFASSTLAIGSNTLQLSGGADFFIAKFNPSGNGLWCRNSNGLLVEQGVDIATDPAGNIIAVGKFTSASVAFGVNVLTNAGSGTNDFFVVKYDTNGNVLSATSGGSTYHDEAKSVTIDAGGNVYMAGYFYGPMLTLGTNTLTNPGINSVGFFLCKYNTPGNIDWAMALDNCGGGELAVDTNNDLLVTGMFSSSAVIGTTTLTSVGGNDVFIAKYSNAGIALWAKNFGNTDNEEGSAICTDSYNNVYLTGNYYSSSIAFGNNVINNTTPLAPEFFVAKYNATGNEQWAKTATGPFAKFGNGIAADAIGNIYATGYFSGSKMILDSDTLNNTLPQGPAANLFLAKLTNNTVGFIDQTTNQMDLTLYPNPSIGIISLRSPNAGIKSYKLYNNESRLLKEKHYRYADTALSIDLRDLQSGHYLIKLETEKGTVDKRIILDR